MDWKAKVKKIEAQLVKRSYESYKDEDGDIVYKIPHKATTIKQLISIAKEDEKLLDFLYDLDSSAGIELQDGNIFWGSDIIDGLRTAKKAQMQDSNVLQELAQELGYELDPDDGEVRDEGEYQEVTIEGEEYMVFPNFDSAYDFAVERVKDDLYENPEYFNRDFLQEFLFVSPTDIRVMSAEMADSYAGDIRDEEGGYRIVEEAGLEDRWDEEGDNEALVDEAYDIVYENYYNDQKEHLEQDPIGWAEELGYDLSQEWPNFLTIDYEAASDQAVNLDGPAHFLAGYDGKMRELPSGAVAFRTN